MTGEKRREMMGHTRQQAAGMIYLCSCTLNPTHTHSPDIPSPNLGSMSDSTHGASSSAAAQSTSTAPSTPSLQLEDGSPSVPGGDSGRDLSMNLILNKNFLGVHKLRVRQVKTTQYTRPINARGLNKLKKSISERDWGSSYTPYVLVPREQVPSGKDTVFSPEFLDTLTVFCLDGNHRIVALSQVKGPDFMVDCRLYLHFDCERTITTLALSKSQFQV